MIYSTGGWFTWDRTSAEWRAAPWAGSFKASDNVWVDVPPKALMRNPRLQAYDRLIVRLLARRWRRWIERQDSGPLVAHICHPSYYPFLQDLSPDFIVYHVYDLYSDQPYWSEEVDRWERALLKRADLVFCPTGMLAEALRTRVNREVRVLPNAADVSAFVRSEELGEGEPADLASVPRPRIGYVGMVHMNIDFGLIARLAQAKPEWHFVLVGKKVAYKDAASEVEYERCVRLPNVHFLGGKRHTDIPPYVRHMDANIMCYRVSDTAWVRFAYPLKMHEYLAAGKPVVSADLPEIRSFSHVIRFASGVDDWLVALSEALERGGVGTPDMRREAAREHTWEARAEMLERWLRDMMHARTQPRERVAPLRAEA